jgi:hypothetical protein
MKDIDVEYSDKNADEAVKQQDYEAEQSQLEKNAALESVNRHDSLVSVMKRGSFHSLASTATGLDDLIHASSTLEMSGDDPEMLKRYSERIAMEADESE